MATISLLSFTMQAANGLSSKKLADSLQAALKRLRSMLDNPSSSQAVKRAGDKFTSLEQLHSSLTPAAAAKPALAGLAAAAAAENGSSSASPFAADISSQLEASACRDNQALAFKELSAHFRELEEDKPALSQLAGAMQATHTAMCCLREGVCKMLLNSTKVHARQCMAYVRLTAANTAAYILPGVDSTQALQLARHLPCKQLEPIVCRFATQAYTDSSAAACDGLRKVRLRHSAFRKSSSGVKSPFER